MKLLLVRHGQMAGDPYLCPDRPVSGCLSPEGVAQAQALRDALASTRIDAAFSSPYGRALQTAEIAFAERGVPITIVPGLEEWKPDPALRDTEQVPLLEDGGIEAFLRREVLPHAPDAWYLPGSVKTGYEISFTRYFYKPQPLRTLEEIRADILALEKESAGLLDEVIGTGEATT